MDLSVNEGSEIRMTGGVKGCLSARQRSVGSWLQLLELVD